MKKKFLFFVLFAIALNLILISPALAIPSPDVMVGLFASASQVLVLLTALLGGVGIAKKRKLGLGNKKLAKNSGSLHTSLFYTVLILLFLSLGANLLQYTSQIDKENSQLLTNLVRSSTEEGKIVGDVSLKTLSFSEQLEHPHGISTQDFAHLLEAGQTDDGKKLNLIDVREPEEIEMGKLKGTQYIHYPNVLRTPTNAVKEGFETIFLCHSGNRSSEICSELTEMGIPCKFVIGGYEKWIAENRQLETSQTGQRKELRDLPNYPNKEVLLKTTEVKRLVDEQKAIFVDVRYPGDFDLYHIPGAINIPLRKLTSTESYNQIQKLPKRPIIGACYDKRSCFYSKILGLRLYRFGYDFQGRYTVPHEYSLSKSGKAHVKQWGGSNNESFLGIISTPLKQFLLWVNSQVGHLAIAIFICVFILRLGTLILTFKGERDQIIMASLSPKIDELKKKFAHDKGSYSRSLLALYSKYNLTPSRNLLGTLAQIIIFLLFFRAISSVAQTNQDSFLWIPQLSSVDPLFILPLLLGGLTTIYLQLTSEKSENILFLLLRCLAGIFLFLITFRLGAAINLYLVLSVTLMMLQNRILTRILNPKDQPRQAFSPLPPTNIVPLKLAHRVSGTGNKAARLGQLMNAGLPVPNGFVITDTLLLQSQDKLEISAKDWRKIQQLWNKLQAEKVAVRSSGENEDGVAQSYAGIFTSVLNVKWNGLSDAIKEVYISRKSELVQIYSGGNTEGNGGILVQEMVDAEFAGVLFTQHPADQSNLLVEVIPGLAEDLVSGKVTPKAYRFGRLSGRLLDSDIPPIDLNPLIKLGQQTEKLFGEPQDIEWAYRRGKFLLLQARNITAPLGQISSNTPAYNPTISYSHQEIFKQEKQRLLKLAVKAKPDEVVFAQNELSELLPQPTPLSLSFMKSLWQADGTTDLACQTLGLPYRVTEDASPFVTTIFGALYINRLEEKQRLGQKTGFTNSFRLLRIIDGLEQEYRQEFLPSLLQEIRLKDAIDFSKLNTEELFQLVEEWQLHFTQETYVQAQMINIAADFSLKLAEKELTRRNLSPATYLGQMPETIVHQAMSLLPQIKAGRNSVSEFLDIFGHRALYDFELSQPRYNEEPELVEKLLTAATSHISNTKSEIRELPSSKILAVAIERARKFQSLKEEAKHYCLKEVALLRRLLVELGQRLEIGDGIFYYTLEELPLLKEQAYRQQVDSRKAKYRTQVGFLESLNLPSRLTLNQLESLSLTGDKAVRVSASSSQILQGTLVAGQAPIKGKAQVITNAEDIDKFQKGNILVTRFTHPSWTPIFPKAGAVITEVGGWLSHAAIVAREYNVPTIVGVQGAIDKIATGDLIKLYPDGTIERIINSDS